jgi:hypothetical protein
MLGSIGTVFAKGPPSDKPGNGPKLKVEKQGFSGNVTDVNGGGLTIDIGGGETVTIMASAEFGYKIPREINKWTRGNITDLNLYLGGNLITRRVVVQAGNVTGTWAVLKLLVLPIPGTQPMHAHRTGVVTDFHAPSSNVTTGNITIIDVYGMYHTFTVGNDTYYRPMGMGAGNITVGKTFVTVVSANGPNAASPPIAKAIVLHADTPAAWPKPTP